MIKANELRIGNWIVSDNDDALYKIETIEKHGVMLFYCDVDKTDGLRQFECFSTFEEIKPVMLYDELLGMCGFTEGYSGNEQTNYYLNNVEIIYSLNVEPHFLYKRSLTTFASFSSLHQLQNLYFALTGQELEVKL
jgi:hypothetical protein